MQVPEGAREFAASLAVEAGALMRERFSLGMRKEWKGDGSPLTATDTEVNALALSRIAAAYPGHAVLSEEGSAPRESEWTWVCDPIDGTLPFSHGYPAFTFALALLHNGQPVLGAVYDPVCDRLYAAEKGKGATLNGAPMRVSGTRTLSKTSIIGIDGTGRFPQLRNVLRDGGCRVVSMYSTVYLSMLVASGEFVAEIYGSSAPWDAAAVKVIVEEAGGRVTDLDGNEQRYDGPINGFLASNGVLHEQLLASVRPLKTDGRAGRRPQASPVS